VIPRSYLLDIANQLAGQHRYPEAAKAYNQFLENYGNYEYGDQVELMLGLLYARHLKDPQKAKEHLEKAMNRLTDPDQVEFCRREIQKLPL
jgi:tetratricopeptide (TPR) repeat protein